MGLRVIDESTNAKWDKYKGLDMFTQIRLLEKKAREFDVTRVNLQATGNKLIIILEDMFAYPINYDSWEHIKFCMDYNNWTLKEIIQAREKMNLLQGNPLQIVSCSKEILK